MLSSFLLSAYTYARSGPVTDSVNVFSQDQDICLYIYLYLSISIYLQFGFNSWLKWQENVSPCSIPVLLQWHIKDPAHFAKSAGGIL